jgi:prophage antirepressor-like protein
MKDLTENSQLEVTNKPLSTSNVLKLAYETLFSPFDSNIKVTKFKSFKDNKVNLFSGTETANNLNHSNLAMALVRSECIPDKDYFVLEKKNCPKEIWKEFEELGFVSKFSPRTTILYESGYWKLLNHSELELGVKYRNWIASEVMPSISKTGEYKIPKFELDVKVLAAATDRNTQIENSKSINTYNFELGGTKKIIEYNFKNCVQVTNKTPNEIKKTYGRPNESAKEILRKTNPECAMTMTMNDYLVQKYNLEIEQLKETDEFLTKTFESLGKLGITLKIE